jgi:ankyrin repeat protein
LARGAVKTDRYHYATLIYGIRRRNDALVEQVLAKHAHLVDGAAFDEETYPLEQAVFAGNVPAFRTLLDAGANLDRTDTSASEYLGGALSRCNYSLASLILERAPTVAVNRTITRDDTTVQWSHALESVSADGNMEWVQLLLDRGAVTTAHELARYPIYGAALNRHVDVVKTLLEAGSSANPTDEQTGEALIDILKDEESYLAEGENYDEIIALLRSYVP